MTQSDQIKKKHNTDILMPQYKFSFYKDDYKIVFIKRRMKGHLKLNRALKFLQLDVVYGKLQKEAVLYKIPAAIFKDFDVKRSKNEC